MRPFLFVLAAGVCLGGLGIDPDGKPAASLPEAVAKPLTYEPVQIQPPAAPAIPADALQAPVIKPAVLTRTAPPAGYICGPSGCYPAAAAAPRVGPVRSYARSGRWYPGKRVVGFLRGRRR